MIKKLDISKLAALAADDPTGTFLNNLIVQEVRAHIGHFQCENVENLVRQARCTICFTEGLEEYYGIPSEAAKPYYDFCNGAGTWDKEFPRSEAKHSGDKSSAFEEGKRMAQGAADGSLPDEGVLSYSGEYPEEFIRGFEEGLNELGAKLVRADFEEAPPTTH